MRINRLKLDAKRRLIPGRNRSHIHHLALAKSPHHTGHPALPIKAPGPQARPESWAVLPHPVSDEDEEAPAQGLGLSPGAALNQLHQEIEEAPKG
jgi:hypothetical protein